VSNRVLPTDVFLAGARNAPLKTGLARPGSTSDMRRLSIVAVSTAIMGCASVAPMRSGPLIDHYARAACVPSRLSERRYPPNGEWDQVVQGDAGCMARVVGEVASTGVVAVEFPPNRHRHVVASFGEKSNPIDVRVDVRTCRLYVRSYGSPLFVKEVPTWLVEYDLRYRRELQAAQVEPQVLPPRCPEPPGAGFSKTSRDRRWPTRRVL
jgi:hypothetical protein